MRLQSATPAVSPATPTRSARHRLDHGDDHPYRRHDPPEIGRQPKPRVRCTARHCSAAGLRRRGGGTPVRDHCSIHSTSSGGGGGGGVSANCASSDSGIILFTGQPAHHPCRAWPNTCVSGNAFRPGGDVGGHHFTVAGGCQFRAQPRAAPVSAEWTLHEAQMQLAHRGVEDRLQA
jgi:hypothetical protein